MRPIQFLEPFLAVIKAVGSIDNFSTQCAVTYSPWDNQRTIECAHGRQIDTPLVLLLGVAH